MKEDTETHGSWGEQKKDSITSWNGCTDHYPSQLEWLQEKPVETDLVNRSQLPTSPPWKDDSSSILERFGKDTWLARKGSIIALEICLRSRCILGWTQSIDQYIPHNQMLYISTHTNTNWTRVFQSLILPDVTIWFSPWGPGGRSRSGTFGYRLWPRQGAPVERPLNGI